jgi:hypothetical protein
MVGWLRGQTFTGCCEVVVPLYEGQQYLRSTILCFSVGASVPIWLYGYLSVWIQPRNFGSTFNRPTICVRPRLSEGPRFGIRSSDLQTAPECFLGFNEPHAKSVGFFIQNA